MKVKHNKKTRLNTIPEETDKYLGLFWEAKDGCTSTLDNDGIGRILAFLKTLLLAN